MIEFAEKVLACTKGVDQDTLVADPLTAHRDDQAQAGQMLKERRTIADKLATRQT